MKQHTLTGTQIRSSLPPFSSIDKSSPLASIKQNTIQSKSLFPPDSPMQPSPHKKVSKYKHTIFFFYILLSFFFNDLWNPHILIPLNTSKTSLLLLIMKLFHLFLFPL